MTQKELDFLQEAMYDKCDNVLNEIVDNANAKVKKEKKQTEKGENK